MYKKIAAQAQTAARELVEAASLKAGQLMVIGCSSSEMVGERIGKGSSLDAAKAAFEGIYPILQQNGVELAVQCCEHLNRVLIMERESAEKRGYGRLPPARGKAFPIRWQLRRYVLTQDWI